jgi:ADP-heptose:LPS heptosyltransferase
MQAPKKILAIRNDKLGDFMLIFPALSLLKKAFPAAELYALVPEYTTPMADLCPWIDHVITDTTTHKLSTVSELTGLIREHKFDAVIDFHPETMTSMAVFLSRIPHRFAPASRLVQLFYNHRLVQRRSHSKKPEFEYNIELARHMVKTFSCDDKVAPDRPPYLTIAESRQNTIREHYYESHHIDKDKKLIVVHPGSGGSAINLAIEDYAQLISLLASDHSLYFVITAGPGEASIAQSLSKHINKYPNHVHLSDTGLKDFTEFLSITDILISGSTGVLHIAGALNVPTVAFYPGKRSATSLRWRTLNSEDKYIAFTSNDGSNDAIKININNCYQKIRDSYLKSPLKFTT